MQSLVVKSTYPCFWSMKQLGVFLLFHGWDASSSQDYPRAQHYVRQYPFIRTGRREALGEWSILPNLEHNAISVPGRARIWTTRSGNEHTNLLMKDGDLHMPWWRSVGFKRPPAQNGAKMNIMGEEIKNLLKEAIESLQRKTDSLNNGFFDNRFCLNYLKR